MLATKLAQRSLQEILVSLQTNSRDTAGLIHITFEFYDGTDGLSGPLY